MIPEMPGKPVAWKISSAMCLDSSSSGNVTYCKKEIIKVIATR
jgi:hypothetical protein